VTICVRRLPEYGTPVPKRVSVTHHKLCFMICIVLYCILLSSFGGQFIDYTKMHGASNIKIITMALIYTAEEKNGSRAKIKFVE